MSDLPPQMQGQETPNPLEMFWERNRKLLLGLLAVLVVGMGIYYGLQYKNRSDEAAAAEKFASVVGLLEQFERPAEGPVDQFKGLDKAITSVDLAELEKAISSKQFPKQAAWLLWVAANRYQRDGNTDKALETLLTLERDHPKHLLNWKMEYPPQLRQVVPVEDDATDAEKAKRQRDPKLEEPKAGSIVSRFRDAIRGNKTFREQHKHLLAANTPTGPKVTFDFGEDGKVVVQLFDKAAPEHVAHLKKLIGEKYFDKQRFYRVTRNPLRDKDGVEPQTLSFGLAEANSADSSGWDAALQKASKTVLDFPENDQMEKLSFFPGTLGSVPEGDGKSSGERLFFAVNDCSAAFDQRRVILGRVVEGLPLLKDLVSRQFQDQTQDDMGIGRIGEDVAIQSVTIEG